MTDKKCERNAVIGVFLQALFNTCIDIGVLQYCISLKKNHNFKATINETMKHPLQLFLGILFFLYALSLSAQIHRINPHTFDSKSIVDEADWYPVEDSTYDVHFYHIDVEIAVDSVWMTGEVKFLISSKMDGFNSLLVDLDQTFEIESISYPVSDYSFNDNVIQINLEHTYNIGDTLSFTIKYGGEPQMPGGYKGLRYETHDAGEPIIATLSTPYLAHSWWPCKDGTSDKADSLYVDITIKDTTIAGHPLIALSNGLLVDTSSDGVMKKFEWRHHYPIVPYYVMVAISNYTQFQQIYDDGESSFPIDYYVFESHIEEAQAGVADMPDAMAFFSEIFGPYPFREEKYGMTQLGYYGGIENQTNTIINNMSTSWLYTSVHELAHMWFADDITCESWHHGWVNEGFASYAEALYYEHVYGIEAYHEYVLEFTFKQAGTLYLQDVSDPFNGVFQSIIYNKGAYVLHMLRGILGDEVFFQCLYEYATNEAFAQGWSTTEDFQMVCEEHSGEDLEYFFSQWIYQERYPKYRYNYISSTSQTEVVLQQSQGVLGWPELFNMPVPLLFHFEDGSDTTIKVFNDEIEAHYSFHFSKEVADVEVDPEKWILRDVTFDDNILVGIRPAESLDFKIYPNPNKGNFTIQFDNNIFFQEHQIKVLNTNGKEFYNLRTRSSEIEIQSLPQGVYLVEVQIRSIRIIKKLVVL